MKLNENAKVLPLLVNFHSGHGCGRHAADVASVRFLWPLLRMIPQHVCFHKRSLRKLPFAKVAGVLESLNMCLHVSPQMKL